MAEQAPTQTPPPEPTPAAEPALDPHVKALVESFETTLNRDVALAEPPPAPIEDPKAYRSRSLTDVLDQMAKDAPPAEAPEGQKKEEAPAPAPATDPKPAEPPKAEEPPPPSTPPKVKRSEADKLREELSQRQQLPPEPPKEPEPAPKPSEEDEWIKGLSEAQREEIDLATFAEKKFPELKGKRQETISYLKRLKEWTTQNPEADPDGDEFTQFIEKNRPRYETVDRRKVERAQLEEQIIAKARAEAEEAHREKYEKLARKQYELEIRPQVQKAKEEFAETISNTAALPEGIPPIDPSILQAVKDGSDDVLEQYPIEAPIIKNTIKTGQEYLDLSTGLKTYDRSNPVHAWLGKFVYDQGEFLKKQPEKFRVREGKEFLPLHEYKELLEKDPKSAAKHWSFSDGQILDMLKVNAAISIDAETKRLTKAGWQRNQTVKTQTAETPKAEDKAPQKPQTTAPATNNGNPPRAGSSISAGAGTPTPARSAEAAFLDRLMPGASKIVSQ